MTISTLDFINAFESSYGFDPSGIYCSVTGKRFASIHIEELESLINLVGGEAADDEIEAIIDDVAMRLLASMRPSMKWNKFREESLAQMRVTDPVETLCYLVNRMFAPLNARKIGIDNLVLNYAERIRAYSLVSSWGVNDETNTLAYMLLELDAKWSLDTEYPPFTWQAFFIDAPDMESRIAILQSWYADRMVAWEKRLRAEETQTAWTRSGNALSKPAFRDAYMESKPLSATAIKNAEKSAEKQLFGDLLFEIMGSPNLDGEATKAIPPKPHPTFVPIRKTPLKFGVKS